MKNILMSLGAAALLATTFTSCNSSDDNHVNNENAYQFYRNGKPTVGFEGQNIRLKMVKEITDELSNSKSTADKIEKMYNHKKGANDFANTTLNESSKNIKSKVNKPFREFFSDVIKIQMEALSHKGEKAAEGKAGALVIGTKTRYVTAKGFEADQLFKKGMIGNLILENSIAGYLLKVKKDNNELKEGKLTTSMEHHWDEAFGYLFGGGNSSVIAPDANGLLPANNEFVKYANTVGKNKYFRGIGLDIFNAFRDGRKAIADKDYAKRDEAIKIIQEKASKVVAVRGVYYLLEGASQIKAGTRENGFHGLSEGIGFVISLSSTYNPNTGEPYFTNKEAYDMLNSLIGGNGFWDLTEAQVVEVAQKIADRFDFTLEQAKENAPE